MAAKKTGHVVQDKISNTGDDNVDWCAAMVVGTTSAGTVLDLDISPLKVPKSRVFGKTEGTAVGNWREIPA